MKKVLFGLAIAATSLVSATANAAEGDVHFKGELQGLKDSLIVFSPGPDGEYKRDTVLTPNGKFDFTINVKEPCGISCYTPGTLRRAENVGFQTIAVPGETAELSGDLSKSYYFSGSKFYQQYNEADRTMEVVNKPMQDLINNLNTRMAAGESQETLMKEYQEKSGALKETMIAGLMDFIKQHPDYEASAAIIPSLEDIDKMKEAVALLSPAVRDGRMKVYYQHIIDQMTERAQAEQEAAKKQASGVDAPDFTLNDINGKPLALSSLRGKYVVLDFWGSWCGWCIKGIPEMKNYYTKYKGKFEILGVDCNDTEAKWKEAVKKYELPWLHVYNPRGSKVLADYGIQGFPTKIVVGPDGKIVKTIVGEDPAFYTFLDETFGK
ncbi:MAG: AhpC/TSA family protein [Prevotella sp.]|nr:AhpC/TSA family protein [Prevotella sp.]